MREKIINLLEEVGKNYQEKGILFELHKCHDIHAYYHLWACHYSKPLKVIHVQGYPGLSKKNEARVWARLMDFEKILAIRNQGISIGNEHEATIQQFPNFEVGVYIPYSAKILEGMLAENIPELRGGKNG